MVAGPLVFLVGRTVYALVVFRAMLWRLPIGVVVLSVGAPMARGLPPLAIAGAMTFGMMAIAFIPHWGNRCTAPAGTSVPAGDPAAHGPAALRMRQMRRPRRSSGCDAGHSG
ncbi:MULTISPECIES: hypothetical protein [unclassified Micromonospora]|uniref:hypothetical protein n=1 Tax=unclassified Micromonospora TaxID=2617518 RepID=UPI0033B7DE90